MPSKTPAPTLVTFLLDRSGSMSAIQRDTIGGFAAYIDAMKNAAASRTKIALSLVQFDSGGVEVVYKNKPLSEVGALVLVPRGSTPLIDACVTTIRGVESALAARKDTPKVVVCFMTDGEENCSREHTWDALKALIKEKQEAGWEFNFMGAGIDAYAQSARMGLSFGSTMSYDSADPVATQSAYVGRGMATAMFASGMSATMDISAIEKLAAGDVFDPALQGAKAQVADAAKLKSRSQVRRLSRADLNTLDVDLSEGDADGGPDLS